MALEAIKQCGWALLYASKELKAGREVVLEAVKQKGWVLQYAPEEYNADRESGPRGVKAKGWGSKNKKSNCSITYCSFYWNTSLNLFYYSR